MRLVAVGLAFAALLVYWLLEPERARGQPERAGAGVAAESSPSPPPSRPPAPADAAGADEPREARAPPTATSELRIVLRPRHAGVDPGAFALQGEFPVPPVRDRDGWTLRGLPRGKPVSFRIRFEPPDFAWPAERDRGPKSGGSRQNYSVQVTEARQEYVVEIDRFAFVEGLVLGPDGEPMAARVFVDSGPRFQAGDWAPGEFALRALPGVPVEVHAVARDGFGTRQPVEVGPLQPLQTHRVTLRLAEFAGRFDVAVVDSAGRPVPGVVVRANVTQDGRAVRTTEGRSDARGRLRFERVPPGRGKLTVAPDPPYALPWDVAFDVEQKAELTVVLHRSATIVGRIPDIRAATAAVVSGSALRTTAVGKDGAFTVDRLPPGRLLVIAHTDKGLSRLTVEVAEGATVRVEMPAPAPR